MREVGTSENVGARPGTQPVDNLQLTVLNHLRIAEPCHVGWERMAGDEQRRFCASCEKSVHNLAEFTTADAVQLVTAPNSHVCIRLTRDADGNVVTNDSPTTAESPIIGRRSVLRRCFSLAAGWLGLQFLAGCERSPSQRVVGGEAEVGVVIVGRKSVPPNLQHGNVVQGGIQAPPPMVGLAPPVARPSGTPNAEPKAPQTVTED